ncbi:pyridoxal phosphate-dependent class II aminotransferase [Sphingobium amiense]|uniref:Aminotransferase n=1 Tax=Sphingobium amiense TaxID=135719 RepID=A0A494WE36_9SPHN|nr:aminotransferase class I/II-fold pyridoxal phosphate-dependent enzyme [Sphingobium amiense]BBD99170.1 pyridoxal phosphate-dependent class II aminotransferase [Sphingobium amiense]
MTAGFMHHGGRIEAARARFGGPRGAWLDLSTGINPNGWQPPQTLDVDWRALPEPDALERLERVAARHFGCDPAYCGGVPGSEAGLRLLARLLRRPAVHLRLAYGSYGAAFARADAVDGLADLPTRPTILVLGNPNNPDGAVIPRDHLLALLDHQERHGGWMIADEAFADCDPGWSIAGQVSDRRRLIVLRSFGKFFGLAGLRLGFVIAPRAVLAEMRATLGDWPLHAAALTLGAAAYADAAWIGATRHALTRRAATLDAVLSRFGLIGRGSCPLFRLIESPDAGSLFRRLAQRHILTRPFADYPDLLRIALPADANALERLEAALG